jgi:hypothetical protein
LIFLNTDSLNCGACGNVCTGGKFCSNGQCTCPSGTVDCGGTCTNTSTDANNCGTCGHVCLPVTIQPIPGGPSNTIPQICSAGICCPDGQYNSGGMCCPTGETNCSGTCYNLQTDFNHCGSCGMDCSQLPTIDASLHIYDWHCCNGACVDFNSDIFNCGACDNFCGLNGTCGGGVCQSQP